MCGRTAVHRREQADRPGPGRVTGRLISARLSRPAAPNWGRIADAAQTTPPPPERRCGCSQRPVAALLMFFRDGSTGRFRVPSPFCVPFRARARQVEGRLRPRSAPPSLRPPGPARASIRSSDDELPSLAAVCALGRRPHAVVPAAQCGQRVRPWVKIAIPALAIILLCDDYPSGNLLCDGLWPNLVAGLEASRRVAVTSG